MKKQMVSMVERILAHSDKDTSSSEGENDQDNDDFFEARYKGVEKRKETGTKLVETFLSERPVKASPSTRTHSPARH